MSKSRNSDVLFNLIKEILKVRAGRGLGTGHPVYFKNPKDLGKSKYEPEKKPLEYKIEPVEVSRAFKRRSEDEQV